MKLKSIAITLAILLALCGLSVTASGCSESEADKVNHNISQQAEYFQSERRVTVWNARTDNVIMYIEGYINISNNSTDELVITAKVGADSYKKNYVYLNDYTLYVVEDINGTHTDPYHYKLYFNTNVLPDIELKP
nr:MAG TPA: protein of unknown function DUF4972 [Caudoviricetes sp.]